MKIQNISFPDFNCTHECMPVRIGTLRSCIESVAINGLSVSTRAWSHRHKILRNKRSIVKFNIFNLQKPVISTTRSTETLKSSSSLYYTYYNQNRYSLHNSFGAWKSEMTGLYTNRSIRPGVLWLTRNIDMLSTETVTEGFLHPQKGKLYYSTQLIMKCPH